MCDNMYYFYTLCAAEATTTLYNIRSKSLYLAIVNTVNRPVLNLSAFIIQC